VPPARPHSSEGCGLRPDSDGNLAEDPNTAPKFLAIKNWEKYQAAYTNGKRARWIKSWVDKYDDPEYSRLTVFQRHILDGIRDMRGAIGKNPPNDSIWVGNALNLTSGCKRYVRRTIQILAKYGFLVLCNEQNDHTTSVRGDKIRVEESREETTSSLPAALQGTFIETVIEEYPKKPTQSELPRILALCQQELGKDRGFQQKFLRSILIHKTTVWQGSDAHYAPTLGNFIEREEWKITPQRRKSKQEEFRERNARAIKKGLTQPDPAGT